MEHDPSSPDFFRQLRLTVQLPIIAVCSGAGKAIYLMAVLTMSGKVLGDFWKWPPSGILDVVRLGCATLVFARQRNTPAVIGALMYPPSIERDFEMEFERPIPRRTTYALLSLRTAVFIGMLFFYGKVSNVLQGILGYFSTDPSWILRLLYTFFVLETLAGLTPDIVVGFYGPSITAQLVYFLIYPYEAWIRRKRRNLSGTFILKPPLGNNTSPAALLPLFQYIPITEPGVFRLLKLVPADGQMTATLEHFPTNNCPPYWAASYVWGPPEMSHSLIISGRENPSRLHITPSCATLLALLTPLETRYIWIDAICINQANLGEKALQIPLMDNIYSGAQQVVGCLSTNEVHAGKCLLSQSFVFDIIRYMRFIPSSQSIRLPYRHRALDWAAFCLLLNNTYWQRVWIVQEMILAKKLIFVYGEASFTWRQYSYAIKNLYERMRSRKVSNAESIMKRVPPLMVLLTSMSDRLDMLHALKASMESPKRSDWPSIAQVVDQTYKVLSTDPRDQIYALLSLASDGATPELKPNYDPSFTYQRLFNKFIRHSFAMGHLNFLLAAGLAYRPEDNAESSHLPSWILVLPKPMRMREGNWAAHMARTGTFHLQYVISNDDKELSLCGVVVDELVIVCPASLATPPNILHKLYEEARVGQQGSASAEPDVFGFWTDMTAGWMEKMRKFLVGTRLLATVFIEAQGEDRFDWEDAYQRAMVMDWDGLGKGSTSPASSSTKSLFQNLEKIARTNDKKSGQQLADIYPEHLPINHWFNYDFAITQGGRMAWVPQGAKLGDVFCAFNGLAIPFLLRLAGDQEKKEFTLIGDAYLHGLMRGEIKDLDLEDRWFNIV